jgi:hypothetical protein
MSTFVDELVNAVCEGQKKRKRIAEFEECAFKEKLTKEWKAFKKKTLEAAGSSGETCYIMSLDFSKNFEFRPRAMDIWHNLPEDLEKLRHTEGCSVLLEHGTDGVHTWEVIINVTRRVNALNKRKLKVEEDEPAANRAS